MSSESTIQLTSVLLPCLMLCSVHHHRLCGVDLGQSQLRQCQLTLRDVLLAASWSACI